MATPSTEHSFEQTMKALGYEIREVRMYAYLIAFNPNSYELLGLFVALRESGNYFIWDRMFRYRDKYWVLIGGDLPFTLKIPNEMLNLLDQNEVPRREEDYEMKIIGATELSKKEIRKEFPFVTAALKWLDKRSNYFYGFARRPKVVQRRLEASGLDDEPNQQQPCTIS